MAIAHEFDYVRPDSLAEAVAILGRHGDRARPLAGGTDLIGWICEEVAAPEVVVDLKGIEGLSGISRTGDTVTIGALTTFNDLLDSDLLSQTLPLIGETASFVGSQGIRNRATLVGNLCSAVPCCDSGPLLLVHEADLCTIGPQGERKIPVADWFIGPKRTGLEPGEIVTGVEVPVPPDPHGGCYVKLGRYHGPDLAQASVAVMALPDNRYRVAFGAVAPKPARAARIEALLDGKPTDANTMAAAKQLIPSETAPIADVRASQEYRALMLPVMFERAITAAAARFAGQGPPYGTRLL